MMARTHPNFRGIEILLVLLIAFLTFGMARCQVKPEPAAEKTPPPPAKAAEIEEPAPFPYTPPLGAETETFRRIELGRSVNGQKIGGFRIGTVGKTVLVIASMTGDEIAGTPLAAKLVETLKSRKSLPLLRGRSLVVIPAANPDGILAETRENANGVDLNRDLESENPQPETWAILKAIETFQPYRIISLRQLEGIDPDGPGAKPVAVEAATHTDLRVRDGKTYPGSLGHYGEKNGVQVITFGIHKKVDPYDAERLWSRYGDALIASIVYSVPFARKEEAGKKTEPPPKPPLRPQAPPPSEPPPPPRKGPSELDRLVASGIESFENGEFFQAIVHFQKAHAVSPENDGITDYLHRSHSAVGKKLFEDGKYETAEESFREALRYRPECGECRTFLDKAQAFGIAVDSEQKDVDKAVSLLLETVQAHPEDREAAGRLHQLLLSRAQDHYLKGAYGRAGENFKMALQYDPACERCKTGSENSTQAAKLYRQGVARLEEKDFEPALEALTALRDLNTEDPRLDDLLNRAHLGLGERMFDSGNYAAAVDHFDRALKLNPDCEPCRKQMEVSRRANDAFQQGVVAFNNKNYAEAIERFKAVILLNGSDPVARDYLHSCHLEVGTSLCQAKKWGKGIRNIEASRTYNPACAGCEESLRECRMAFNQFHYDKGKLLILENTEASVKEAIETWRKVDPDFKDVRGLIEKFEAYLKGGSSP